MLIPLDSFGSVASFDVVCSTSLEGDVSEIAAAFSDLLSEIDAFVSFSSFSVMLVLGEFEFKFLIQSQMVSAYEMDLSFVALMILK